jgi:hypothetical protein
VDARELMTGFRRARAWFSDRRGAAATEFALLLPGMLFLIFGIISLSVLTYAEVNLNSAVQAGARYASVQTATGNSGSLASNCTTSGSVCYYVRQHYKGPGISLAVSCSPSTCLASGCGHSVTGTGAYKLNYGFGFLNVPLTATACFP